MKVVINRRVGGYSLSAKAVKRLADLQGKPCYFFYEEPPFTRIPEALKALKALRGGWAAFSVEDPAKTLEGAGGPGYLKRWRSIYITKRPGPRNDPLLVQAVEELGAEANGCYAKLAVVEIPDDVKWYISEDDDGAELIEEKHRTWG